MKSLVFDPTLQILKQYTGHQLLSDLNKIDIDMLIIEHPEHAVSKEAPLHNFMQECYAH